MGDIHDPIPGVPILLPFQLRRMQDDWIPKVEAWLPIYLRDFGNASIVYLEDGAMLYAVVTATRLFRSIASYYHISIRDFRQSYIMKQRKSQSVPLIICSRNLIFFSIKTRCPDRRTDGAIGYVANTCIDSAEMTGEASTRIRLRSGRVIDAVMSLNHFEMQRDRAELFEIQLTRAGILPGLQATHHPPATHRG